MSLCSCYNEGMKFGEYLKRQRIDVLEETLRGFCRERDLDPGNLSKIERGLVFPRLLLAKALIREYGIPGDCTEVMVVYMREQTKRTRIAFGEE